MFKLKNQKKSAGVSDFYVRQFSSFNFHLSTFILLVAVDDVVED